MSDDGFDLEDETPEMEMMDSGNPASDADSAEIHIPDGIGLSLDAVRGLLAQKHETLVAKDDPMLMVGTLLNAYLGEVEKQNQRLQGGMAKLLAEKTDGYVKGVQTATDSLSQAISAASVEAIEKVVNENAQQLTAFKQNLWLAAAVVAISALINVAAFAALALR